MTQTTRGRIIVLNHALGYVEIAHLDGSTTICTTADVVGPDDTVEARALRLGQDVDVVTRPDGSTGVLVEERQ